MTAADERAEQQSTLVDVKKDICVVGGRGRHPARRTRGFRRGPGQAGSQPEAKNNNKKILRIYTHIKSG